MIVVTWWIQEHLVERANVNPDSNRNTSLLRYIIRTWLQSQSPNSHRFSSCTLLRMNIETKKRHCVAKFILKRCSFLNKNRGGESVTWSYFVVRASVKFPRFTAILLVVFNTIQSEIQHNPQRSKRHNTSAIYTYIITALWKSNRTCSTITYSQWGSCVVPRGTLKNLQLNLRICRRAWARRCIYEHGSATQLSLAERYPSRKWSTRDVDCVNEADSVGAAADIMSASPVARARNTNPYFIRHNGWGVCAISVILPTQLDH